MKWNKAFYRLIDINCNNNIEWLVCFNYVCFLKQLTFKLRFTCSLLSLCSQMCLICDLHFFFPPKCFTVSLLFSLIANNISGRIAWGRLSTNSESCNGKKTQWAKLSCPFFLAHSCKSCGCFNVCMCNGKEVRDQSRGEQQQGWEMSGKERKEGVSWLRVGRGARAGESQGPGGHRGRDAACECFTPACEKRIGDERKCKIFAVLPRMLAAPKSLNF